jgi:NodT family efflux transporter outer membrane factor (OMF) lipoprotein
MAKLILCSLLLLAACTQQRQPMLESPDLPETWLTNNASDPVPEHWLESLQAPYLDGLVERAVDSNYQLAQQALQVNIAQRRVGIVRADRLPTLNVSLSGQRFRPIGDFGAISELLEVSANIGFELDLWGRLSDAQRGAELDLAAEKMRYLSAERRLVAQTVSSAFNVISAKQLQDVFSQRLDNLEQGLDVIEKGYRSGLSEALAVYLARNTVEQERANVANQRQVSFEATSSLELLLAYYPSAQYTVAEPLPVLVELPEIGIPSELLKRRPDIQSTWLDLLATDAALAVAHKDRFPSLDLSGSVRDVASAISRLVDGGDLAFSVAASLFQPLFQGGRLQALEAQARLRVVQSEQRYLEVVFAAFAEVENELSRAVSLQDRYNAFLQAEANAASALTLAFAQYQRGLVNFTTVLESQRRAFDAQTTVVQLRNQLLQSRVALLLALGGNF